MILGVAHRRQFKNLSEQEILALAISSEEDDARIYSRWYARLSSANTTSERRCGRIAAELRLKLGLTVSPRTVGRYLRAMRPRRGGRRSQRWATFVRNHAHAVVACDFFTTVTVRFRVLYVLVVLEVLGDMTPGTSFGQGMSMMEALAKRSLPEGFPKSGPSSHTSNSRRATPRRSSSPLRSLSSSSYWPDSTRA